MNRIASVVCVVLFGASCGQEHPPEPPRTVEVPIQDIAFPTAAASARIGDTVEWVNKDVIAHTATAKDGQWNVVIAPNEKGRLVLATPGTIDYYCTYHPNMTGKIVVQEK
jgi:plastocyanin